MSFLRDFLQRCSEDDLQKLKRLDLRGNEYDLLHHTIKVCRNTKVDDDAIQQHFKFSKSYFDKLNSVLLNKCSTALTDGSHDKVLSLFLEKDLVGLFKHELKIRERKIDKTASPEEKQKFYRDVFHHVRRFPVAEYDDVLTKKYAEKCLANIPNASEEDEAEIWLMFEFSRVFVFAASGKMKDHEPKFLKTMQLWWSKISDKPYYRAQFHYHLSFASYYDFFTNDYAQLVKALQKAIEAYDKADGAVAENYKVYAITKLAKAHCQGSKFEEALKLYSDAFERHEAQLVRNLFHPLMYSIIAIINGKYDEAKKMMDEHLKHLISSGVNSMLEFDILRTYAILHMNKGEFDIAFDYLERALQFNRTEMSLLGDILLRMVHNAYFVMIGDLETAKSALQRNQKFLNSKQKDKMTEEYGGYFTMLRDIIKHREGKKLPDDFAQKLQPYRQGIMKLYGDLLDKMID